MEQFEETLKQDLHNYLLSQNETDKMLPTCPDIEERWESVATAYIPDGIREFQHYPEVSLGWMMYTGMAIARIWDTEWDRHPDTGNLYTQIRDKRGYDYMDEYIREELLALKGDDFRKTEEIVGRCAARVYSMLMRQHFEPGTKDAFRGYVACLHQLYIFGAAMQLKRMGYHMTKAG